MSLLSIRNLRVDFDDLVAVNDLTLEVEPGDVVGLVGPNGAGKTTTMRAAAGLQPFARGEIKIADCDLVAQPREAVRHLGFMQDAAPLYDRLSVWEYLDHFARANDILSRRERIDICLSLTWLTEKSRALCGDLSRGMKQRLTLARTLLTDPPVLLLDEPASGIDPLGRIELRKVILDLQRAGKAILVSSHVLTEMSEFCNKMAILERGKLVTFGRIDDLVHASGRRPIRLGWRAAGGSPLELLATLPAVSNIRAQAQEAIFDFAGSDDELDALLPGFLAAGVRVTEWTSHGDELEHVLLRSGANKVS